MEASAKKFQAEKLKEQLEQLNQQEAVIEARAKVNEHQAQILFRVSRLQKMIELCEALQVERQLFIQSTILERSDLEMMNESLPRTYQVVPDLDRWIRETKDFLKKEL